SAGAFTVTLTADDGQGGIAHATTAATVAAVLTSLAVTPSAARFSALGVSKALTVTGKFSDASQRDFTHARATNYQSTNPLVAGGAGAGIVQAVANGSATITARYKSFAATADITVETGVTLTGLAMTPATSTLRSLGATEQFAVRGTFSDGSVRDLSAAATGTEYTSSDPSVLAISADGLATSHGAGVVTVSARNDTGLAT